jgi:hypothetical protein
MAEALYNPGRVSRNRESIRVADVYNRIEFEPTE